MNSHSKDTLEILVVFTLMVVFLIYALYFKW
jgi:hypothetical protein